MARWPSVEPGAKRPAQTDSSKRTTLLARMVRMAHEIRPWWGTATGGTYLRGIPHLPSFCGLATLR